MIRRLVANQAWLELTWILTMLLPPTTCRSEPISSWQSTENARVSFPFYRSQFAGATSNFYWQHRCHFEAASHRIALKSPACYPFLMRLKAKKGLCTAEKAPTLAGCASQREALESPKRKDSHLLSRKRIMNCPQIRFFLERILLKLIERTFFGQN